MNRSYLVKILELLKPALAKDNMVPIFQNFTFESDATVRAYDDQIAIIGPTEIQDSFAIHGNTILGLLSNSSAENVEFELKGNTAIVSLGKTISKLPFDPPESFIFKKPTDKWAFKIPFTESLYQAIEMCLNTVSKDTTQAALLGITIQGDKLYSCNGDAITRVQIPNGVSKNRALMSTPFCEAIVKLWSTLEMTKGVLNFSSDWVYADFEDWEVYGRVLEIKTPIDFEKEITKTIKTKTPTQALPDDFSGALSRARVLADPETQKTRISVVKGKVKIHTETHMGEVKDELNFKGHPDVDADVNAAHLQNAIQYCDQIAFLENCTVLEKKPDVLHIVSNMG